jgi:hypothetical protein
MSEEYFHRGSARMRRTTADTIERRRDGSAAGLGSVLTAGTWHVFC